MHPALLLDLRVLCLSGVVNRSISARLCACPTVDRARAKEFEKALLTAENALNERRSLTVRPWQPHTDHDVLNSFFVSS